MDITPSPTSMGQRVRDTLGSGYMAVAEVEVYDLVFLKRGFVVRLFSEVDRRVLWREPRYRNGWCELVVKGPTTYSAARACCWPSQQLQRGPIARADVQNGQGTKPHPTCSAEGFQRI
jgi:hypothetical protein